MNATGPTGSGGDSFWVCAGAPLTGTVRVAGATKNAGLKQMAAALLAPGTTSLRNFDPVLDLDVMIEVMSAIGAEVDWSGPNELRIDATGPLVPEAPYELVTQMRASINVLGPLLARCGEARVAMPGGDNIGSRKLDMHFRGLQAMGVELEVLHGFIEARCDRLSGARIVLDFPSNGATENLLTASVMAKGDTVIENAAREPEISDLAAFLNRMGARVSGAGTSTIEVEGVESLHPVDNAIMGDRIEAGTLIMACGIAGGEITIEGTRLEHLDMVVRKLGEMGLEVSPAVDGLTVRGERRMTAADVATLPYPGFATDFMPLVVALLTTAEGSAIVTENVFDNRFGFVDELSRMGADVRNEGRHAIVRGVDRLSGAPVRAHDVRAGAALVLAGLAAEGETRVLDPYHVDRGYSDLAGQLSVLGATVRRMREGVGE
jgi:UDP-N-acetylglucosamine 1-carboxyvinyltransferase